MEKIAIIDIGSNSARLVLVNVLEGGYFVVFDELKESVRLGQDLDWDGFLKPQRVAQTIKTLKMFRRLCDANGIDKIYAYATAAVRRAKNQKSFLEEVAVVCGIKIKVLTEAEQAHLVYLGVINSMDIPKGLIMEMGGGSTSLTYYNRRTIVNHVSFDFGTITLTDLFKDDVSTTAEKCERIQKYVKGYLDKVPWLANIEPEIQFIGVGGAFRNLGRISKQMKKYPFRMTHNYDVPFNEYGQIYKTISSLELDSTMKIKGLSSGRADIFPSALAAVQAVFETCNFPKITISGCGLREGAMFKHAVPSVLEKPIGDVLGHSLNTLMNYFDINIPHAEHVLNLSVQLYRQLKVLHKLPRVYLRVLKIAALLHDSGMRIKYYNHEKHSSYIILNSNLYGVPHKDLIVASFVAGGHRKAEFNREDLLRYKDLLTPEDLDAIRKLSVILRIAESFDRSMSGVVTGIDCDVLGGSVIVKTEAEGDCSLEIKDALTCTAEFKSAYGKCLEIL